MRYCEFRLKWTVSITLCWGLLEGGLRISIEMAGFSIENSTKKAASSTEIHSIACAKNRPWRRADGAREYYICYN